MKLNGKTPLFAPKPIGFSDSSIGRLAIYAISHGSHTELVQSIGADLGACEPKDFVKRLVPYICWPTKNLTGDQTKPDDLALTADDVDRLTDADLDAIAGTYVEKQEYLYRKEVTEQKTDAEGRLALSMGYGEVEHPRKDGESGIQYLHRLMSLYEEQTRQQMKALTKSLLGPAHFSQALSQNIVNTVALGEQLSRLTKGFSIPDVSESVREALECPIVQPSFLKGANLPDIDVAAIERNRRAPFEQLGERLDQLIALTGEGITFATESNKTQTRIAAEIKASGEESSKIGRDSLKVTRWGFYATIAVFALTVAGLVPSEIDRRRGNSNSEFFRQQAEHFTSGLDGLSKAMAGDRSAATADLKAALAHMEQNRSVQEGQILAILTSQAEMIRRQGQDRLREQKTIEALERKLSELEAWIDGHRPQNQPEPQTQPVKGSE